MSSQPSAAVHFTHNTDLAPGEDYLASVPRLQAVLTNPALLETFAGYDRLANGNQRALWRLGLFSLWFGGIGLIGIATKVLLVALHDVPVELHTEPQQWYRNPVQILTVVSETLALLSILVVLGPWFARTRREWLTARFMTERIRQWHFQLLLDGALVARARSAPKAFETERARRWTGFMSIAPSAEGEMNGFIHAEKLGLAHSITDGDHAATDEEVCRAYRELRFDKQQAYFQLKREQIAAKNEWSESVARWTLFSAMALAAAQLVLFCADPASTRLSHTPSVVMSVSALILVVVSAAIRVYRSALALSEQSERYESKFVRLVGLRAAFDAAATMHEKRLVMRDVELMEVEEMREFLRQMRKSSFLL